MASDTTHPMSSPAAEQPFRFVDLRRVMAARRDLIRNTALVVFLLTVVVMMSLPRLYSSSAVVMLSERKNNVAEVSSVLSELPTDPSSVQNQIQILSSRDLALQVIAKLKLDADPEFNPALAAPSLVDDLLRTLNLRRIDSANDDPRAGGRDAVVNAFLSHLDVEALGLSTSITVSFTSRDPAKAAAIANALVDTYLDDQVATKVEAARKATEWLTDRMHQLSDQVQAQEQAVAEYKAKHNLVDLPNAVEGNSLIDQQIVATNTQLIQAKSDLAEKQATYDRAQAMMRSGDADDISQIVASPLIVQLRTQQADLIRQEGDLSSRYGPNHPKMIAIETQKRDLELKIAQETARLTGSIANDVQVARAQVASIAASLAQAEKQESGDSIARVELNALESNLASTRTTYESFVSRLRATQDQDDILNPESQVISRPPVPAAPSSPHRLLFIGASIPVGLLLGVLLALLAEKFDPAPTAPDLRPEPLRRPAMARPVFQLPPVLAELPATADWRAADLPLAQPQAPYSRAISGLLTQVFPGRGGRGRIVALSSPRSDAGKSVIALALARTASRHGLRTVLLDASAGRPVIAPALGYRSITAGLAELLNGAPLSQALLRDPKSSLYVLSAAGRPGAAHLFWSAPKVAELFDYLRRQSDLVVIDAGPVLGSFELAALARYCDRTVLVVPADAPQAVLADALAALSAQGVPAPGLVIER